MRKCLGISQAANHLVDGGAIILDTDTVAGIAVSANNPEALHILYDAKSRESEKPIAWLVSEKDDLLVYGKDVPDYAIRLARKYWPGGLTLVVDASSSIKEEFVSIDGTIGLRMPDNQACLLLAKRVGYALAATSANESGVSAPEYAKDVDPGFAKEVPVLEFDESSQLHDRDSSVASTVIDCTASRPTLIREGTIPFSEIDEAVNEILGDISCE